MGLETGTYIDSLNSAWPLGATDPKSEGDDHLRLIKSTVLNTFANITGAVTATHTELNLIDGFTGATADLNIIAGGSAAGVTATEFQYLDGVTSAIQTQLDAKQASDAGLTDIAALAVTNGNFIVGDGSNWVAEVPATAVASLGFTATAAEVNAICDGQTLASADDVIDNFPAGTLMLFQQTAAPTGWTKQTTHNNKSLRIVSGTASSGGSDSFTTTFGSGKTTDSHTLATSEIPSHTHAGTTSSDGAHVHAMDDNDGSTGDGVQMLLNSGGTTFASPMASAGAHTHTFTSDATGGAGGHTHTLNNFDLQYVDLIIASKD